MSEENSNTISVHRVMSRAKLTLKRINADIAAFKPVAIVRLASADLIDHNGLFVAKNEADFKKTAKAQLDSITQNLNNYFALRCALLRSNSGAPADTQFTTIAVNDNLKLTVAEVIECRRTLTLVNDLVESIRNRRAEVLAKIAKTERQNDVQLADSLAKVPNDALDTRENAVKYFTSINGVKLVDPLDTLALIEKYEQLIQQFADDVDVALSESNASTKVNIEQVTLI